MTGTVEIPTGALVGFAAVWLVLGIFLGRSWRVMRRIASAHQRVHMSPEQRARTGDQTNDQRVVVVVDRGAVDGHAVAYPVVDEHQRREDAGLFDAVELAAEPQRSLGRWEPEEPFEYSQREGEQQWVGRD